MRRWPGKEPDLLLWGIMKVLQPRHLNSMSQNQKTITHLKPPSLELLSNEAAHHGPMPASANSPFPRVDPSSPQHVADSSIPVLKIHEGQTIPILPLDTSPPATPVWHLTDEKNIQL